MAEIRQVAINSYRHGGLSYNELDKLAKVFDNLTDEELKLELANIESNLCRYSSESVALYRIAMTFYNFICRRHAKIKKIC